MNASLATEHSTCSPQPLYTWAGKICCMQHFNTRRSLHRVRQGHSPRTRSTRRAQLTVDLTTPHTGASFHRPAPDPIGWKLRDSNHKEWTKKVDGYEEGLDTHLEAAIATLAQTSFAANGHADTRTWKRHSIATSHPPTPTALGQRRGRTCTDAGTRNDRSARGHTSISSS